MRSLVNGKTVSVRNSMLLGDADMGVLSGA